MYSLTKLNISNVLVTKTLDYWANQWVIRIKYTAQEYKSCEKLDFLAEHHCLPGQYPTPGLVRSIALAALEHELDECFEVGGRRWSDPHSDYDALDLSSVL